MKRILTIILMLTLAFPTVACNKETPRLDAPSGVEVSETALVSWNAVENATGYTVTLNGSESHTVTDAEYQASADADFTCTVRASAEKYKDSPESASVTFTAKIKPEPPKTQVTVGINGKSEVKSGKSIILTAEVSGAEDKTVEWKITEGGEYARIDANGKLTAVESDGDKIIKVAAVSNADSSVTASKVITLVSKPVLTQAMLDELCDDKIAFEGYITINLYTIGLFPKLYNTYTTVIKTAMDGINWYAEYENASGATDGLYYKNYGDKACQVGVDFENNESYEPMKDDADKPISWDNAGLYNNFKGLSAGDFKFNENIWRYEYVGRDAGLAAKMTASANPYDFIPSDLALIIEDGSVMGIYSKSKDDYSLQAGYKAVQELIVAINYGETVKVPTIGKYSHESIHDGLQTAINNMRALKNYTLDFKEITASYLTQGYVQTGFTETITENDCYYRPYTVKYNTDGEETHNYTQNGDYGYKKISDTLYNTYSNDGKGEYSANRAFSGDFSQAKPTFAFAAEIFRTYYEDKENGTVTYYVDELMSSVASTFFYGVGNDINLYGIFAAKGYTSQTQSFTPYVVVKDGYITEACFYFNIGSIYGVVELKYNDFGSATLPEGTHPEFTARNVPISWSELNIEVSEGSSGTEDDHSENALEYLKTFFGDDNIGDRMPFFGDPLGDTYGFGLTTVHIPGGNNGAKSSIVFYYDVPLDVDYTINSSLKAVEEYLLKNGFSKNKYGEFDKGDIAVAPVDTNLDLMIYVWKKA